MGEGESAGEEESAWAWEGDFACNRIFLSRTQVVFVCSESRSSEYNGK